MKPSLSGFCILNTRPVQQAQGLTQSLEALGATVICCPALQIDQIQTPWEHTLSPLSAFDIAIFISVNAVHYFFARVSPQAWPQTLITLAIGKATAKALFEYGIVATSPIQNAQSETLLALSCLQHPQHQPILIIKGEGGRPLLAESLIAREANVTELAVYQRTAPQFDPSFIQQIWQDDLIDIILLTSQQAMEQLFDGFGQEAAEWLKNKPCLVISQRLAEVAYRLGSQTVFMTQPEQIIEGLMKAYKQLQQDTKV